MYQRSFLAATSPTFPSLLLVQCAIEWSFKDLLWWKCTFRSGTCFNRDDVFSIRKEPPRGGWSPEETALWEWPQKGRCPSHRSHTITLMTPRRREMSPSVLTKKSRGEPLKVMQLKEHGLNVAVQHIVHILIKYVSTLQFSLKTLLHSLKSNLPMFTYSFS